MIWTIKTNDTLSWLVKLENLQKNLCWKCVNFMIILPSRYSFAASYKIRLWCQVPVYWTSHKLHWPLPNFGNLPALKGTVSRDFRASVFSSNNTSRPLIHGLKPFWILLRIRRDMIDLRTQKSCRRCQWHRMQKNLLLCSPFKFIYFLVVGYANSGTYLFLIDIAFKGCQGR
jgi:hypothetical protein